MFLKGNVGEQGNVASGQNTAAMLRMAKMLELVIAQGRGRFAELCDKGRLFSDGGTVNALSANTITLTATTTPILGVWNPATSTVNLEILQASLVLEAIAGSAVVPGAFVWAMSVGNAAISTGRAPLNRKNMTSLGSQAKGMYFTALTGLTNNMVILDGAHFGGLSTAMPSTATSSVVPAQVQQFDGSLFVPPGGVLALLNTTSTTTVSAHGSLMWAEVPI